MTQTFSTPFSGRRRIVIDFDPDSSMTQQSEAPFTTIKSYLDKYARTGVLGDPLRISEAQYGDFTKAPDYQTALETVQQMHDFFNALPSDVRRRFKDDPGVFAASLDQLEVIQFLKDKGIIVADAASEPDLSVPSKDLDGEAVETKPAEPESTKPSVA